jgi:hypothetical protein
LMPPNQRQGFGSSWGMKMKLLFLLSRMNSYHIYTLR